MKETNTPKKKNIKEKLGYFWHHPITKKIRCGLTGALAIWGLICGAVMLFGQSKNPTQTNLTKLDIKKAASQNEEVTWQTINQTPITINLPDWEKNQFGYLDVNFPATTQDGSQGSPRSFIQRWNMDYPNGQTGKYSVNPFSNWDQIGFVLNTGFYTTLSYDLGWSLGFDTSQKVNVFGGVRFWFVDTITNEGTGEARWIGYYVSNELGYKYNYSPIRLTGAFTYAGGRAHRTFFNIAEVLNANDNYLNYFTGPNIAGSAPIGDGLYWGLNVNSENWPVASTKGGTKAIFCSVDPNGGTWINGVPLTLSYSISTQTESALENQYQNGYSQGYTDGLTAGGTTPAGVKGAFAIVGDAFKALSDGLAVQVLPGISLGLLLGLPIMGALLIWLIRLLRGN